MPEKTDHSVHISDIEILVPRCSTLFTSCKGDVRITIVYTILELQASMYEHLRIFFRAENWDFQCFRILLQ